MYENNLEDAIVSNEMLPIQYLMGISVFNVINI